jgi:hypothetical protein
MSQTTISKPTEKITHSTQFSRSHNINLLKLIDRISEPKLNRIS